MQLDTALHKRQETFTWMITRHSGRTERIVLSHIFIRIDDPTPAMFCPFVDVEFCYWSFWTMQTIMHSFFSTVEISRYNLKNDFSTMFYCFCAVQSSSVKTRYQAPFLYTVKHCSTILKKVRKRLGCRDVFKIFCEFCVLLWSLFALDDSTFSSIYILLTTLCWVVAYCQTKQLINHQKFGSRPIFAISCYFWPHNSCFTPFISGLH